ncbi:MAG: DNA-directed RNA polymerase subunit alpha [Candidatus Pacebacteria bacterium]|nr:DNA-directed RNA polymerase subunit alpha [Candidatus Paceibacterota bacterium]MDD4333921.1 DNA-directed RNA polymerase subunit alpha [Candidatus Paceibacterota bacterium]
MISLPTSIKKNNISDNYGIFEIEPFYPGYGVTVGNALRRVALSSLEGAAVSTVKIKDVSHEFTAMPGVREDVLHILLNLKQLRFKLHSDEPQKVTLKVKGEREVTGKDFELSSDIELANKDEHIATLTDKKAEIEIEITIEKGFGYKLVNENTKEKKEIGTISLDRIFTPIKKVNYTVENVRVGDKTDFDKLIFEIETDGTITPENALIESIKILNSHFQFLEEELTLPKAKKVVKKAKEVVLNVSEMEISEKAINALTENGYNSVTDITLKTEEELSAIKGVGKKGVKEIKKVLEGLGLNFKI